jgi:maltose-binding protein MalE
MEQKSKISEYSVIKDINIHNSLLKKYKINVNIVEEDIISTQINLIDIKTKQERIICVNNTKEQ